MKHLLTAFSILLSFFASFGQDIIVKTDKTEIKSKVAEITETVIKYKKWDNPEGPLYNLSKKDVFMIIYANGQREIIKQPNTVAENTVNKIEQPSTIKSGGSTGLSAMVQPSAANNIDTSIDYKALKVKYKPTRLHAGFQSPVSIGSDKEFRIVKNMLNLGFTYDYTFPKDDYILESNFGFVYASLYAPLNRLMGNYKNQDKGLFVFAHAGYGATTVKSLDFDGKTASISAGGFTWRAGLDYYIGKDFGISVSTFEFKTFYGGIVVNIF